MKWQMHRIQNVISDQRKLVRTDYSRRKGLMINQILSVLPDILSPYQLTCAVANHSAMLYLTFWEHQSNSTPLKSPTMYNLLLLRILLHDGHCMLWGENRGKWTAGSCSERHMKLENTYVPPVQFMMDIKRIARYEAEKDGESWGSSSCHGSLTEH